MKTTILSTFSLLSIVAVSEAATIAAYDFSVFTGARNDWNSFDDGNVFNGGVIMNGSTEATVASGITLSNLTDGGPGSTTAGSTVGLAYSTASLVDGTLNMAGYDNGGNGNDNYLQFTLAGTGGNTMNINSLTIGMRLNGGGAPANQAFIVSVDGGAFTPYGSVSVATTSFSNYTFTQSITGASTVTFRYVPFGPPGSTGNIHINGLSVDGTVIPEPTSAILLGLGTLGLISRRRRA